MTTTRKSAATRSNLVRMRRRLDQVQRGAALLKKKRESLVAELFERVRPAVDTRRAIEEQTRAAYRVLLNALAANGHDALRALGWPTREVRVELAPRELWGIRGMDLERPPSLVRSLAARGGSAGPGDAAASVAAQEFERLLEQLLAAAPEELFMRRLGQALSHATRLVNTLEQRVEATLHHDLAQMRRTLEEREREEHVRLKRIVSRRTRQGR